MLTFDEAQQRVLALAEVLPETRVPLAAARGRVLAADVRARADWPAFDASTMDGYAVRAADVTDADMAVVGESRAGTEAPELAVKSACRIFTGAPMPRGADAVVMQEDVERDGDRVRFRTKPAAGAFVRKRGDDLRAGDIALAKGTRVSASCLAMLASLDCADVLVTRAPRVAIVPTGDELRAPGALGGPASIAESNSPALEAMALGAGATVATSAPVPDDLDRVKSAFEEALRSCDVLVTIGGVSVGEHDVVKEALEACGVRLDFWRVAIKPGKPLAVGKRDETIVLGLPGNPVSAMITFALFGVPLLRAMQGDTRALPRRTRMKLAAPASHKTGRLELARARVDERGVTVLPNQASGAIVGLCRADVLASIPADVERLDAGAEVDVFSLAELGL
ncbi:MAG TPA: gephyrin-like molybdotransferase Glp [Polyangiaceae bacterium]|nr:gephyrin-like molybdotransferase Glp [Polyangiaceae bacterium]